MKQEEFIKLMNRLKRHGFSMPPLKLFSYSYSNKPEHFKYYSMRFTNKVDLESTVIADEPYPVVLPLQSILEIRFADLPIEIPISRFIRKNSTPMIQFHCQSAYFSSLYDPKTKEIPLKQLEDIPATLRSEFDLIDRLKKHIYGCGDTPLLRKVKIENSDKTWEGLFVELIRLGKLKWANILGETFPYVISTSEIIGDCGVSMGGLYFVAGDLTKESWQEQITAYHDRFCRTLGHEETLKKDLELAKALKKGKQFKKWREDLEKLKYPPR